MAGEILENETNTIRKVARLIGLMVDYSKGIDYGEAYYRRLEGEKTEALRLCQGNFDRKMSLDIEARQDIFWYLDNIDNSSRKIRLQKPALTVVTDSSDKGTFNNYVTDFWAFFRTPPPPCHRLSSVTINPP